MLRVCQGDGYAGLADYKVYVIIELSSGVWEKLIMQQLQKALTPWSFSQESFTTRKSLSCQEMSGGMAWGLEHHQCNNFVVKAGL